MNVKIGAKIKALRNNGGITQEKLADALGVTSQAVSKWESGAGYPDIEYIAPIANFFDVTIDQLFCRDAGEKQKKIDEYCEKYDALYREWGPAEERIGLMRQALAEFPAEEKLLVRLATALWLYWSDWSGEESFDGYSTIDGKWMHDVDKYRRHKGWEEPVKILEELRLSSVDDQIRAQCRDILSRIYGAIGEKEKAAAIAEYCPDCKTLVLYDAFYGIYNDETRALSQKLLLKSLWYLRCHLMRQTNDKTLNARALEYLTRLYELVFFDGNYGFYNCELESLYVDYAENLLERGQNDEALSALKTAYGFAKGFDVYLDKLRRDGEYRYTSPFTDRARDVSDVIYAAKQVPELLNRALSDKNDTFYKKLGGDPRFTEFLEQIKKELAEGVVD